MKVYLNFWKVTVPYLNSRAEEWQQNDSNWRIREIEVNFIVQSDYKPLRGSSFVNLPVELKKGFMNIKNDDNECFRWCHVRMLNPVERSPQ